MEAGQGIETTRSNWVFDEKVAPRFDEHVRKSVPDYDRIQDVAASFSDWFLQDGGTVIDLGASTGETLLRIQSRNPRKDIKVIGYDNSPWVREVMEAIVDPRVKLVSILPSVQSSRTTVPELTLCYIIANLPGPTLWLDQTDEDAKDHSESRIQKLFEECEPVKLLFHRDRHKKRHHTIHFANGMTLWILGAHNKTNLQRRSIRWLIGDETWRWPTGHMAEAEARVTAFGWLGKCIFMSQGGEENDDTHRKFETTDMREWTFACPECGHRQAFLWENVEWSKSARGEDGEWDFAEVRATPASCNSSTRSALRSPGGNTSRTTRRRSPSAVTGKARHGRTRAALQGPGPSSLPRLEIP